MIQWWNDFADGDLLKRREMVDKLHFAEEWLSIANSGGMTDEQKLTALRLMLTGFFENAVETMYEKYNGED